MKNLVIGFCVAVVVILSAFSFGLGQRTDGVELAKVLNEKSTLDEVRQMREQENGRSPLPLICGMTVIFGAFLTVLSLKDINKVLRSLKALSPFSKKGRNGRLPTAVSQQLQYPPYYDQPYPSQAPQLMAGNQEDNDHDF